METKTLGFIAAAFLVGVVVAWLGFNALYADDLTTAQSIKQAVGEDAYLARGNTSMKTTLNCTRSPFSRAYNCSRYTLNASGTDYAPLNITSRNKTTSNQTGGNYTPSNTSGNTTGYNTSGNFTP